MASHNPSNWCGCDKCRSTRVSGCPHYPGCSCHEARRDAALRASFEELAAAIDRVAMYQKERDAAVSKLRRFKGWRVRYELTGPRVGQWQPGLTETMGISQARSFANSLDWRYRNVTIHRVYRKDRGAK
jgi:hypothetical protein